MLSRHTFASWFIANGESLVYVKEQLGHHSIQITVDTYGHLIPGANRKAVNALDDPEWRGTSVITIPPAEMPASKGVEDLRPDSQTLDREEYGTRLEGQTREYH